MVRISAVYEGGLRCRLTHGPSGKTLDTDAPKDNLGKGESFSPTDLAASALVSCMLTTMAIYGQKNSIELSGAHADVTKEMSADAPRRIVRLAVNIQMPKNIPPDQRAALEKIALNCPVTKSLDPQIEMPVKFQYSL